MIINNQDGDMMKKIYITKKNNDRNIYNGKGWVVTENGEYFLTAEDERTARNIVKSLNMEI